jgi:hypothetical protein
MVYMWIQEGLGGAQQQSQGSASRASTVGRCSIPTLFTQR